MAKENWVDRVPGFSKANKKYTEEGRKDFSTFPSLPITNSVAWKEFLSLGVARKFKYQPVRPTTLKTNTGLRAVILASSPVTIDGASRPSQK